MTLGGISSRLAFPLLFLALPAHAGRPLTVDDAAIAEEKGCQVESWIDHGSHLTTGWFVPSCNFGFDTEWQVGFARTNAEGRSRFSDTYAQFKVLLRDLTDEEPWGVAVTAGFLRHVLSDTYSGWNSPYVIIPFSQKICNTPLLVHANVGWSHDRALEKRVTLWGAAVEGAIDERTTLLGEVFNDNANRSYVRVGGRWTASPHLSIDLSFVARPSGATAGQAVSIGFFWQSGPFMP